MSKSHLLKYLLISPNLPVGGFCYSEGMESYLHNKNLTDSNSLKDLKIISLDLGALVSGTKFRGQLEERLSLIMQELNNPSQGMILFIDEFIQY